MKRNILSLLALTFTVFTACSPQQPAMHQITKATFTDKNGAKKEYVYSYDDKQQIKEIQLKAKDKKISHEEFKWNDEGELLTVKMVNDNAAETEPALDMTQAMTYVDGQLTRMKASSENVHFETKIDGATTVQDILVIADIKISYVDGRQSELKATGLRTARVSVTHESIPFLNQKQLGEYVTSKLCTLTYTEDGYFEHKDCRNSLVDKTTRENGTFDENSSFDTVKTVYKMNENAVLEEILETKSTVRKIIKPEFLPSELDSESSQRKKYTFSEENKLESMFEETIDTEGVETKHPELKVYYDEEGRIEKYEIDGGKMEIEYSDEQVTGHPLKIPSVNGSELVEFDLEGHVFLSGKAQKML